MRTLRLKGQNFNQTIKETTKSIKKGQIVICPTDTVYGLVCDATNKKAVSKLLKIKKRPVSKKLPIFVKDIKMAKNLTEISKEEEYFLKKVWPGKVTVVFKKKNSTIGLRMPDYKFINRLLSVVNRPLIGTSANISGRPASTRIKEVLKQFKNQKQQPDLVVDVGGLKESHPSMVIDLTVSPPKVLRI